MAKKAISDKQIGKLKRAAVDAWVKEQENGHGFGAGYTSVTREKDHYVLMDGGSYRTEISRPSEEGVGGGLGKTMFVGGARGGSQFVRDEDWTGYFCTITDSINDLLRQWRHLPDGKAIAEYEVGCNAITTNLSVETWEGPDSDHKAMNVDLNADLLTVRDLTGESRLRGSAGTSFRNRFLNRLPATLQNHRTLSLTRGAAVAAQASMWSGMPGELSKVISTATKALDAIGGARTSETAKITNEVYDLFLRASRRYFQERPQPEWTLSEA